MSLHELIDNCTNDLASEEERILTELQPGRINFSLVIDVLNESKASQFMPAISFLLMQDPSQDSPVEKTLRMAFTGSVASFAMMRLQTRGQRKANQQFKLARAAIKAAERGVV